MCGRVWIFLGLVVSQVAWSQQNTYEFRLRQSYIRASGNAPDSVDVVMTTRRLMSATPQDTLASSNLPFFHNATLNFSGARVLHMHKFSNLSRPTYYDPITYPFTLSRVNVTIRRKLGYTGQGDTLALIDTILILRVPVISCGPGQRSLVIWDTAAATVLNSVLQPIKPRITSWLHDTLLLCPSFPWPNIPPARPLCVGQVDTVSPLFSPPSQPSMATPDSMVILARSLTTGQVLAFPRTGGTNRIPIQFFVPDTYRVHIRLYEHKCGCYWDGSEWGIRVHPAPAVGQIIGRDTVYVGGTGVSYTYTANGVTQWRGSGGITNLNPTSSSPTNVTFSPPGANCRSDTLWAIYENGSCRDSTQKVIAVCPCRPVPPASAYPRIVCTGQRATVEIPLPFAVDSLRWQYWDGTTWQDVQDGVGLGATATLYVTPPLQPPGAIFRAKVYTGSCMVFSQADTIVVSGVFLDRNLYSVESPICTGDTAQLAAHGRGVWITDGQGTFTDTLDPNASYISSPNDPPTVRVCWVIRSVDLGVCREVDKDTLCTTITIQPAQASGSFALSPSPAVVCPGEPMVLQGTITQGVRSEWSTSGSGVFSPAASANPTRYIPGPADAGQQVYLTFTVYGSCGQASYTDSILVQAGATPVIVAPNQICENTPFTLAASATSFDSVRWWQGDVAAVQQGTATFLSNQPTYSPNQLSPGNYIFTLQAFAGSCVGYDELTLSVLPAPMVSFQVYPNTPYVTNLNNPEVTFINTSQGATRFIWNFGDPNQSSTDSSSTDTVRFEYSGVGRYSIVLFGQNDLGCANVYVCTECVVIIPRKVFLPNAFSPNGDGKNDLFRVLPASEGTPFVRLEVYDRWGQLVYSGDNIPSWDGRTPDGKPLDEGAYTYKAFILMPDEGLVTYTGVVHIVR